MIFLFGALVGVVLIGFIYLALKLNEIDRLKGRLSATEAGIDLRDQQLSDLHVELADLRWSFDHSIVRIPMEKVNNSVYLHKNSNMEQSDWDRMARAATERLVWQLEDGAKKSHYNIATDIDLEVVDGFAGFDGDVTIFASAGVYPRFQVKLGEPLEFEGTRVVVIDKDDPS